MTATEPTERQDFEALVRRHQAQVCAVARAVLRDRARSEEVAQDAFLIAWRDRAAVTPSVHWICGIARNLARNAARRLREAPMTHDPRYTSHDPRDELITREDAARAEDALARLPERYREAVLLYYGAEESIADVASALGISQASARQRVHRGRERLRDLLAPLEPALRATRPTAAFTAACLAAWAAGKPAPAYAAAVPKSPLLPMIGAGVVALGATAALVVGVLPANEAPRPSPSTFPTSAAASAPRAALQRRFPTSARPVSPASLPLGVVALGPSSMASAPPTTPPKLVDLDFRMAPLHDLMQLLRNELETPIWVSYETDAKIDIATRGERPAIEVLDEVLARAGANRAEVAAIRIVPGGRTDAAALGGAPVTLSFRNTPLNLVLGALEPELGMPIGRLGVEVLAGQTNDDGSPAVESSPSITLEIQAAPAGVALEQALLQAGVGYELTTGFVILPR